MKINPNYTFIFIIKNVSIEFSGKVDHVVSHVLVHVDPLMALNSIKCGTSPQP